MGFNKINNNTIVDTFKQLRNRKCFVRMQERV